MAAEEGSLQKSGPERRSPPLFQVPDIKSANHLRAGNAQQRLIHVSSVVIPCIIDFILGIYTHFYVFVIKLVSASSMAMCGNLWERGKEGLPLPHYGIRG